MVDKVKLNQSKKKENLFNFLFQIFVDIIHYTRPWKTEGIK